MPLWDLEELLAAQDKCFPKLTPKHVEEQFKIYGGVPRFVLELSASDADAKLQQQVRDINMETLFDILSKTVYTDLSSSKTTSVLIHLVPDPSFLEFKCVFASDIICRMLIDRFLNNSDFSMLQVLTRTQRIQALCKLVANEEGKTSARTAAAPDTNPEQIARFRVPYD